MRRLLKRIESALAAVAFAEEGEVETARRLLADADREEARPRAGAKAARGPARPRGVVRPGKIARSP